MWFINFFLCLLQAFGPENCNKGWHSVGCSNRQPANSLRQTSQSTGINSKPPVRFQINLTDGLVDPVGIGSRKAILINDNFIGPTLYAKQNDEIEFEVHNYMRQSTAIHFHGVLQSSTPWSDGVPGLTQEMIEPGASYLYRWTAEEAGTYFYHGHAKAQMMDGLYGSIVIEAEPNAERPFHLISEAVEEQMAMGKAEEQMQPILISDWTQFTSAGYHDIEAAANIDFSCMDAIIVNGIGSQYCLETDFLDNLTNPVVRQILEEVADGHLTDKGCIPPLPFFNGDYELHPENIPPLAYTQCVGGENPRGNLSINVDTSLGWAALTFINPSGLYPLQFSIDNHEAHVYATDGRYVHPTVADRFLANPGSRISLMIKLNQERARYSIRIANDYLNQVLGGFAMLAYDGAEHDTEKPEPKTNFAGLPINADIRSFTPTDSKPFPAVAPSRYVDATFKLLLKKLPRPYGAYEWTQTGDKPYEQSQELNNLPLLFQQPDQIRESELVIRTNKGDWVDVVMVTAGPFAQAHPMHKHGSKVFVLGAGRGNFPWANAEEALPFLPPGTLNFEDPPYVDTFSTVEMVGEANDTWTLIRYQAEYPGAWLFHCHVQTHLSGGMGMVILDGVDDFPDVPVAYREWNGYEPR